MSEFLKAAYVICQKFNDENFRAFFFWKYVFKEIDYVSTLTTTNVI